MQTYGRCGRELLVGDRRPRDHRTIGVCVHARCGGNILRGHTGYLCHSLQRILVDPLPQLVEAHAPVSDKCLVIEALIEDHLKPAQAHGGIGARPQSQMNIRPLCLIRDSGVEHNNLGTPRLGRAYRIIDWRPRMLARVVAEQHDAVGRAKIRHGEPAVGKAIYRSRIACAQSHPTDPIWRPQEVHEASIKAVGGLGIPARCRNREGLGAVLLCDGRELCGDLVHGLLVGNFLPTVFASLANAF